MNSTLFATPHFAVFEFPLDFDQVKGKGECIRASNNITNYYIQQRTATNTLSCASLLASVRRVTVSLLHKYRALLLVGCSKVLPSRAALLLPQGRLFSPWSSVPLNVSPLTPIHQLTQKSRFYTTPGHLRRLIFSSCVSSHSFSKNEPPSRLVSWWGCGIAASPSFYASRAALSPRFCGVGRLFSFQSSACQSHRSLALAPMKLHISSRSAVRLGRTRTVPASA